jgi:hypothetical protein
MNYTEVEAKVREATNDETWGPHGSLMQEIAKFTFTYEHFPEVMSMLWKRMLESSNKNWRRTYKVSRGCDTADDVCYLEFPYSSRFNWCMRWG